jgi:hypothetical protein
VPGWTAHLAVQAEEPDGSLRGNGGNGDKGVKVGGRRRLPPHTTIEGQPGLVGS